MGKYLTAFLSTVPAGQKRAILQLLERDKASGKISSKLQFDQQLEQLVAQLAASRDFDTSLKLDYPDGVTITSDMLNNNFRRFYVALHGLFHQMNRADATVKRHRAVRKSDFDRLKAAVNKLVEDVSVYRFLRFDDEGWSEARFSNFTSLRNANTSVKAADVDERTHNLRMRVGTSRQLHQISGSRPARAYVTALGGGQQDVASKSFKPENILDNKLDTFWAHLALADMPLVTSVDGTQYNGAMAWVTVELPNVEQMSYLSLVPFGSHPVEMVQMQYWTGEAWEAVTGWTPVAATLDSQEFGFEEVQTNKIRILLRQENYTQNTYLIPRRLFNMAMLWEMVADQQLMQGVQEEQLTDAQHLAVETNPRFRALVSALSKWDSRMMSSGLNVGSDVANELTATVEAATAVMTGTREGDAKIITKQLSGSTSNEELGDTDMIEVTKVEYLFGLYHLALEHRDYLPIGVYESPMYDNTGVPYEVALDVDESHVTHDDGIEIFNRTSIEYELEIAPERRVPILPHGSLAVSQELLRVEAATAIARTRFPINTGLSYKLRANGATVDASRYTVSSPNKVQINSGYQRNAIYTFDYTATSGSDLFDIDATYDSQALDKPEMFTETDDNGMVRLAFYPFVAREILNDDENWYRADPDHARYFYRVENGDVAIDGITYGPSGQRSYEPLVVKVDGILAQNLTNYRSKIQPAFIDSRDEIVVYQYVHVGNKLYFCRPIKGSTIEVRYRWISQYTRLVATLRGHQPAVNPYTPLLKNFRIKSKTSRL